MIGEVQLLFYEMLSYFSVLAKGVCLYFRHYIPDVSVSSVIYVKINSICFDIFLCSISFDSSDYLILFRNLHSDTEELLLIFFQSEF